MKITLSQLRTFIQESLGRGRTVKLYHISPHADIQQFRGRWSPKLKMNGIFASPNKRAIIDSWSSYVASKKGKQYKQRYQNLTLYTLSVPWESWLKIRNVIPDVMKDLFGRPDMGDNFALYGAWGWDEEVFIPDEFLRDIKIVGRTTQPAGEFYSLRAQGATTQRMGQFPRPAVDIEYKRLMDELADLVLSHRVPAKEVKRIKDTLSVKFNNSVKDLRWVNKKEKTSLTKDEKKRVDDVIENLRQFMSKEIAALK